MGAFDIRSVQRRLERAIFRRPDGEAPSNAPDTLLA